MLSLSERGLTDERLALAMSTVPPRSIVLFEDIDAAFPSRESHSSSSASSLSNDLTLSGLLNALDGIASSYARFRLLLEKTTALANFFAGKRGWCL